jgi:hypothetical protein
VLVLASAAGCTIAGKEERAKQITQGTRKTIHQGTLTLTALTASLAEADPNIEMTDEQPGRQRTCCTPSRKN